MARRSLEPVNDVPVHPRPGVDPAVKRYGRFDPDAREYVITRPDTPQPWHNYMTNGQFTGYVSHTGRCSCHDNRGGIAIASGTVCAICASTARRSNPTSRRSPREPGRSASTWSWDDAC